MEAECVKPDIKSLPNEILSIILNYTTIKDAVHFGSTCKQFNELVTGSQGLWKRKMKITVKRPIYAEIDKIPNVNWYNEIRKYYNLKTEVIAHIIEMTSYYYNCKYDITLDDVRRYFSTSFSNGIAYYSTIDILQELHKKGTQKVATSFAVKPYTLTEMHYAKVVLQHMIHAYLTLKWVQSHVKNNLPPEIVLNFFLQWVDPLEIHTDQEVIDEITALATLVEDQLQFVNPAKHTSVEEQLKKGEIAQAQVIATISHIMYKVKEMGTVLIASFDTLNIMKVLQRNVGHDVVFAAIYHAIARRFGIQCELISFPNHLFLEWRSTEGGNYQTYKIELDSGILSPKRMCPFSRNYPMPNSFTYCPDSLLQFVISTFLTPLGNQKNWYMQNALYLLDFLSTNHYTENRYNNYLPYLLERTHLPALGAPIEITRLTDDHLRMIILLSCLTKSQPPTKKDAVCMKRTGEQKYSVGMICYHRMYDYVCVVRGWERQCRPQIAGRADILDLQFGANQSFYIVVAVDQSERYIAQEQLVDIKLPTRMQELEDTISKEFTHFNGYSYVPNGFKQLEYPDDKSVCEVYRCRAKLYGFSTVIS